LSGAKQFRHQIHYAVVGRKLGSLRVTFTTDLPLNISMEMMTYTVLLPNEDDYYQVMSRRAMQVFRLQR